MIRSVFKSGNSLVVALPGQLLDELEFREGADVDVAMSDDGSAIEIPPVHKAMISPDLARKVDEFIAAYRPALEALSQR